MPQQHSQNKRKFLGHYESSYIRPSKYLLLSGGSESDQSNNDEDEEKEPVYTLIEKYQQDSKSIVYEKKDLMEVGDDCLMEIAKYFQLEEFCSCICVCKHWGSILIPTFMKLSKETLDNNEHLVRLSEHGTLLDACEEQITLFSDHGTWKPILCYEDQSIRDEHSEHNIFPEADEDLIEHNDDVFHRMVLPFGSPLCKGTIVEQFELVQDDVDVKSYKEIVAERLGIPIEEQGKYEISPFIFYDEILREQEMIDPYIVEIQESLSLYGSENYESVLNFESMSNFERASSTMTFHGLRLGIAHLLKRGGVLFSEPSLIEDALYELKKIIYLVIKDAYEVKFPNKTEDLIFEESTEQYSRYYKDPPNLDAPCFDDNLDADSKLSETDIISAFKRVLDKRVYFAPEQDPYLLNVPEYRVLQVHNNSSIQTYYKGSTAASIQSDVALYKRALSIVRRPEQVPIPQPTFNLSSQYSSTSEYSDSEPEMDYESESEMDSESESIVVTDENFIDDTDSYNLDLDDLGQSLPEQLMLISIVVHEEVYGKQRAHEEKLYLQNWYGNSKMISVNCSDTLENPPELVEEEDGTISRTEREQIDLDKKEDIAYFGYSLHEDALEFPFFEEESSTEPSEQATEEESLRYQLRRMLRERSHECIQKYCC